MKTLLPYFFCLLSQMLFAHGFGHEQVALKHWTVLKEQQQFDASFLMFKNDEVYLEKADHEIVHFPLLSFSAEDQAFVRQKYARIEQLNNELQARAAQSAKPEGVQAQSGAAIWILWLCVLFSAGFYHFLRIKSKRKYIAALSALVVICGLYGFKSELRVTFFSTDPAFLDAAFAPFKPKVNTFWDNNYFYVESKGIPDHVMMVGITAWQQQVPIPQCYTGANAWPIPLNPVLAATPVPVNPQHFIRGAIAVAANGIPIFNPYTNTGVDAFLDGQLDNFGGHCGRADDYHYHIAPLFLDAQTPDILPIAFGLDGFAVYGAQEPDGAPMSALDANHGHFGANGVYHYHGTPNAPYMIGKMVGKVTEDNTLQIIPQAAASPVRPAGTPLTGAVITGCQANGANGYILTYTKGGQTYSIDYNWTPTGQYNFKYISPTGTTTQSYNGFVQCKIGQDVPKTMLRLPDTGQTGSYTNTFGEDADYLNNAPFFIDNGNGTVTDTVTGLMWQKADGGEMTLENAATYCDGLSLAGYTDWRLPNAHEAFSILNHNFANPALNGSVFTASNAEYWWTSDYQANDNQKVWVTNAGGGIGNHPKSETISAGGTKRFHVRAVRALHPPTIVPHFTNNGNGTVTDNLTGLIWQKVPLIDSMTWEQSLAYAENLSLAGFSDWRLPNIKELQSLNDETVVNPSVSTSIFSTIGVKKYWSSTSLPNQTTRAWYWDTAFGITTYDPKTTRHTVICCRFPTPPLSSDIAASPVACFGEMNGALALNVAGGLPPYSFSWSNGATTQNLSGLAAGSYTVTITDANTQTATQTATITQPQTGLSVSGSTSSVDCFGNTNGAIELTASGGQAGYSFEWNDGNTMQSRADLSAGTYTATVTDANGCSATISQTVTQPAALAATSTTSNVACFGNETGSIQLIASGGQAGYSYLWNDGNTEQLRQNLPAGAYSATVSDANSCTTSIYQTIAQPDAPLSVADSAVEVTCFGATSGAIHLFANGGTPAYTYAWNDGNTDQNRTNLPAGTYSVTVTDANQCSVSVSKNISEPAAISTVIFATDASCGEQNGSIHADISGGTAPYTIIWSDNSLGVDLINIPSRDYGFTITDANGCTFTDNVIISNLDGPSTQLSSSPVTCNGGANGSINLVITGGTAPFSYHWNDGTISPDRSNLIAGTYVVTVTDANGCASIVARTITEPAPLYGYITTSPEACGYQNGALSLTINGGTAPYQYHWSNNKSSAQISYLSAGDYTVTVTDAHGCTVAFGGSVGELSGPSVEVTTTAVSCAYTIDGSYTFDISGGTPPYNFPSHYTQTGQYPGMYTQDIYDANGCYTTVNFSISAPEPVFAMLTTIPVDCYGNASGGAEITAGGGTPPYTYGWNNGQNTQTLTNVPPGFYVGTVTDAHGCSAEASVHLIEPAPLFLTFSATASNGANIGTVSAMAIGGTLPYTYLWSNGATEADLSQLAPGAYTVTVTDAHNCTITGSEVVDLLIGTMSVQDTAEPGMLLHPNPASDKLFVTFSSPDMQVSQLRISNAIGRVLKELTRSQYQNGLNITQLQAGVYFLQVTEEKTKRVFTQTFTKL